MTQDQRDYALLLAALLAIALAGAIYCLQSGSLT